MAGRGTNKISDRGKNMGKEQEKRRDIDYALDWYKYGLDNDDDAIYKFMMHWIAFNWLYSECHRGNDTLNIGDYCEKNFELMSRFDAFSTDDIQIFLEKPVKDEAHGFSRKARYEDLLTQTGAERLKSLLLTIYQVRCNLFHGSKSLRIQRDLDLVHASAAIMEGYLKAILGDDLKKKEEEDNK